ncbi:polycystic kidney disease 2-like 2 protein isoform X4 [Ursus americanus]|uniref:Polycystic kidney disease 2-like 2 protein isoform X4 n=1 Tax=Ursus maritimus TaxID=29073 RepID=A0A384C4L6_URSMA|nr:polycystic kidney disease 2-like 2 protein isoform X4 [Ursus maritimus]XP_045650579.1 polycystic kidney disease 2-like 2 protein isoform X4 [Ursus americanus]
MAEASRWHRGGTPKPNLHYSKEVEIRTTLQELALYFIFLINLCILTFGMVNPHMYYLNKVMSSLFLDTSVPGDERTNFKSIRSITDFWKFMEGPLLEGLYWDAWYTKNTLYDLKNSSRIYYENILLGVPRVRQLKVRNNTCKVYSSLQSLMNECYDRYTSKNEDLADFGLKAETEWKYATPESTFPWHWGFVGVYRNGGFIFTLSKSKSETKNKFVHLQLNSWITRGTRVIFIDFSLYNANVNLFCIIRLVAEFPATGGIITSWQFYSVKLLRYVSYYDYIIASCEITFCIFLIVFTTQEAQKVREFKSAYFKSVWNWLELLLLVLCFVTVAFNIYCNIQIFLLLGDLLKNTEKYSDFYFLAYWHTYYNNILAVTIFFAWIKNMFLAIINDTYSEVKADYSIGRRPDFELGKMIKKSYNNALEKLRLKKPEEDEDKKSTKSGDLVERARREGFDENEIQSAKQMKKWKERLEKKYYSAEIQDDYQPVTQQEFRELFLYAVELEKELHYVSLKLNRVMRKISTLQP